MNGTIRGMVQVLGSLRLTAVSLVAIAGIAAVGTFAPQLQVYSQPIFIAALTVLGTNTLACTGERVVIRLRSRHPRLVPSDIVHAGLLVVLFAAALSTVGRRTQDAVLVAGDSALFTIVAESTPATAATAATTETAATAATATVGPPAAATVVAQPEGRGLEVRVDAVATDYYPDHPDRVQSWRVLVTLTGGAGGTGAAVATPGDSTAVQATVAVNKPVRLRGWSLFVVSVQEERIARVRTDRLMNVPAGETVRSGAATAQYVGEATEQRGLWLVGIGGAQSLVALAAGDRLGELVVESYTTGTIVALRLVRDNGFVPVVIGLTVMSIGLLWAMVSRVRRSVRPTDSSGAAGSAGGPAGTTAAGEGTD